MDHRPFEGWLLNNQLLTTAEDQQLKAHLQVCSFCRALAEVNLALKSVKMASPEDGFTERFTVRLEAQKKVTRRRNIWGFLFLAGMVISTLTLIAWPAITGMLHSPVEMLVSWFGVLITFWTSLEAMAHAGYVLFRIVPGFIPTLIWIVFLFTAAGWSLLWVFSFIKFSRFSHGVKQ